MLCIQVPKSLINVKPSERGVYNQIFSQLPVTRAVTKACMTPTCRWKASQTQRALALVVLKLLAKELGQIPNWVISMRGVLYTDCLRIDYGCLYCAYIVPMGRYLHFV